MHSSPVETLHTTSLQGGYEIICSINFRISYKLLSFAIMVLSQMISIF